MSRNVLTLYGLKFNPFRAGVPVEALYTAPAVESFCHRVALGLADGGFAMVSGDSGCGKSAVLRLLAHRLSKNRDHVVGTIEHPQSRVTDFYRELGELFGIGFPVNNRWGGFKALRSRWSEHIGSTLSRPVLIVDEAQEMVSAVFTELRILASKDFDSKALLCVIFSGDSRLPERFREQELIPVGNRMRRRLTMDYAAKEEMLACLEHLLQEAGNPALMSQELKATIAEHSVGNYRVLMNIADELLSAGAEREVPQLDEKLYLEVFTPPAKPAKVGRRR